MVGPCLGHSGITNAVGKEATPPEFTFFEAPVYAPGLQSTCVRSCLKSKDKRSPISPSLFGRKYSACMAFGMSSESPTCGRTGGDSADAGVEYISP
jgi:hypothetical protein